MQPTAFKIRKLVEQTQTTNPERDESDATEKVQPILFFARYYQTQMCIDNQPPEATATRTYYVETHTFRDPLFTHVDTTFVFTLASQPGRKAAMLARLRHTPLTAIVRFIINPGAVAKGLHMNTCDDLLHANKLACTMAISDDRPAIFLEDDCEFTDGMSVAWAGAAEHRIQTVDAIAFGSFMGLSFLVHREWIRVVRGGVTHGMLLSPSGMAAMLRLPYTGCAHDSLFYARAIVHAPRRPVGVQRHYRTQNSLSYDRTGVIMFLLTAVLRSETEPVLLYNRAHTVGRLGGLYTLATLAGVIVAATLIRSVYTYYPFLD